MDITAALIFSRKQVASALAHAWTIANANIVVMTWKNLDSIERTCTPLAGKVSVAFQRGALIVGYKRELKRLRINA